MIEIYLVALLLCMAVGVVFVPLGLAVHLDHSAKREVSRARRAVADEFEPVSAERR